MYSIVFNVQFSLEHCCASVTWLLEGVHTWQHFQEWGQALISSQIQWITLADLQL